MAIRATGTRPLSCKLEVARGNPATEFKANLLPRRSGSQRRCAQKAQQPPLIAVAQHAALKSSKIDNSKIDNQKEEGTRTVRKIA